MKCRKENIPVQMLVYQILHLTTYRAERLLEKYDLKRGQAGILFVLEGHSNISQRELADLLSVKPPTITSGLKKMEKLGYIVRTPDQEDQRVLRLQNTEKGTACVEKIRETMKEMEQIMYRGLSREEVLLLRRLLMQIRDNFFENEKDLEAVKNETFT